MSNEPINSADSQLRSDLELIQDALDYTLTYHEVAQDHLAAYKILQDKGDDWPFPHDVRTPDTFSLVEDYVAKIVQGFTSVEPIIAVKKKRGIDPARMKMADQLETVLQAMFQFPEGQFHEEFENFCRQAAIHGTGFISITPVLTALGTLDYIRFETLDFWSVFPDPRATSIERSHHLLIRKLVPQDFLFANPQLFPEIKANADKIASVLYSSADDDQHKQLLADLGLEPYIPDNDLVELFYIFQHGKVRIIANRKVYVANDDQNSDVNPFVYGIPVEDFKLVPQVKEFYGIGIPYIVSDLQTYRDTLRSMRLTNIDLSLNSPVKVKVGSEIDPLTFALFPGAVIPVIEPTDIEPFVFPDTTSSSYKEDMIIQADMEQATALHKAARGYSETKRQTGTEVIRLQQAALSRIDIQIKRMEKVLQRIARRCVAYIREFMDPAEYRMIVGEEDAGFFKTPLRDFMRYWQMMPVGSAVSSIKEIRARRQAQAYQLLTAIPPDVAANNLGGQAGFMVDLKRVVTDLLAASDIPNPQAYIIDLPPPEQQPQGPPDQMQQMQAMLQQMSQGPGPEGGF